MVLLFDDLVPILLSKFVPKTTITRCCFCIIIKNDVELAPNLMHICPKKSAYSAPLLKIYANKVPKMCLQCTNVQLGSNPPYAESCQRL